MTVNVLSLFSGVGGFDLGLENAGMETVFQCEWDKHATKILERHWPDVPRWGDITTLTGEHILRHAPRIDVVAWGSPCQDLSIAGNRAGLGGERSGLFHEGIRIINEIRRLTNGQYPRISIWENVAGALSSGAGADFGQVLATLDEAGACFSEWRILDAQYFGVPQRRRRVFVISVFDPATAARCPDPLLPVSEGVQWHPATSNTARQAVAGEVAGCLRSGGAGGVPSSRGEHLVVESAGFGSSSYGGWTATDTAITLSARDYKGGNTVAVELFTEPVLLTMREGCDGGGKGPLLSIDKSLSLGTGNGQTLFQDAMAVRRLTPLECERLMGWPDDWTAGQSDTHRYKQCGNGIASPVAEWIGKHLQSATMVTR